MTRPLRQGDAVIAVWKRYGRVGGTTHCAHLFEGTRQLCPQRHSLFEAMSEAKRAQLREAHPVEIHASGLPFGRTCQRCRKLWAQAERDGSSGSEVGTARASQSSNSTC